MIRLLLAFVICLQGIAGLGQSSKITTYTTRDGLSCNDINTIAKDSQGFLWIGTDNGLNRWDGNNFTVFSHNPADSSTIAGNQVQAIYPDRKNRLWLGTNEGISLFDPVNQRFDNFAPDTTVLQNIGTSFGALCEDNTGNLWVGTKNDLLIFDEHKKKFRSSGWKLFAENHVPASANHLRVIVIGIIPKSGDEFWVLSTYGLFSVNTRDLSFRYYRYDKPYDYLGCQLNYADSAGNVWISLFGAGLLCYHSATRAWSDYHTARVYSEWDNAYSLKPFAKDTLMYASCSSILFLDQHTGSLLSVIPYDNKKDNGLRSVRCRDILRNKDILWLATSNGLVKISLKELSLRFTKLPGPGTLSRVYRSSRTGRIVYCDQDACYLYDGHISKKIPTKPGENARFGYFLEAPNGLAYLTDDNDLYRYDQEKNTVTEISLPPKRDPNNDYSVRNMTFDRNGILWVRTVNQGIFTYDPATGRTGFPENLPHKKGAGTAAMHYDSLTNTLWFAQEFNGVSAYDIDKKTTKHFLLNKPPSQRGAAINCITGNNKGKIWACSLQSGLLEYSSPDTAFTLYSSYNGLISDYISWIVADRYDNVWIGARGGISKFSAQQRTFTNYYSADGYPSVFDNFLTTDDKGNIYLATDSGYYQWKGNVVPGPVATGKFYLRKAQINNNNLPLDSVYSFGHADNNLVFQFGWLCFETSQPGPMEYRLNNGVWVTADLHMPVSFASLSPGRYRLIARVKNNPAERLVLNFAIAFAWWQKPWLQILAALLIISMMIFFIKRRTNSIRRQATLSQQLTESRMTALRSQMNPHFIFNILNSINSFIIENKTMIASNYLNDFSRLVRMVLEHSQKNLIPLSEELKALKLYLELESRRLENSFDYRIDLESDLALSSFPVPPLLIQPFVENAIWHGLRNKKTPGRVEIKISRHEKGLMVLITDDGIGRAAAKKLQPFRSELSFGIDATIQRVSLANPLSKIIVEDLYHRDGSPAGTQVCIYL